MPKAILIHGDDRIAIQRWIDTHVPSNAMRFYASSETLEEVFLRLANLGLFSNIQDALLEGFAATRDKSLIQKLQGSFPGTLYLREHVFLTPEQIKKINPSDVRTFRIKRHVFTWLDSLKPNTFIKMIHQFHALQERGEVPELLWRLLSDRLRLLISAADGEISSLPDWQKERLHKQIRYFRTEQLKKLYLRSIETEYAHKTGASPFSLPLQIELLLSAIDRAG